MPPPDPRAPADLPTLPRPIVACVVLIVAVGLAFSADSAVIVGESAGITGLLVWAPFICADLAQAVTLFVAMTSRGIHAGVRAFAAVLTGAFLAAVTAINYAAHDLLGVVPPLSAGVLVVLLHLYRHSLATAERAAEAERAARVAAREDERRATLARERAHEIETARLAAEREAAAAGREADRRSREETDRRQRQDRDQAAARVVAQGTATERLRAFVAEEIAAGRPVPTPSAMVEREPDASPALARRVRADHRKAHPEHFADEAVHAVGGAA